MNLKTLKSRVIYCLQNFPETRNSDAVLTFRIIYQFLPDEIKNESGKWWISTNALKQIREDAVKRIRARIQNEKHLYLPTEYKIRKARNIKEEDWRKFLGYNPEMREIIN